MIPRFLSYRLSQVVGIYLRDIIPFRFMIKPDTPRHGFIFSDGPEPWTTGKITDVLTRETSTRIGFRMTTQEYRHIAIAIDRKFIRGWNAEADDDDEDDDAHDLMSAHSTKIAIQRYARLGGLTRSLSPEPISVFRGISDKWQRFYGLKPRKPVELGTERGMVLTTTSPVPVKEKIR